MADSADGARRDVIEPGTVDAPELPAGLTWFNTQTPLTIRQLRGKIVLLDFWTYCCINCMHVLEDLARLESRFPNELVVIGVHSAKFDAEKVDRGIREAILRYGIGHPVVNDADMRVWNSYGVRAWPSFMLIDPLGKVFGTHSGERVFDLFDRVISQMVSHYRGRGQMRLGPLEARTEAEREPYSFLSYPGKVLADPDGGRLFIADTNHHRIVVADLRDGSVLDVVGGGEPDLRDGAFRESAFRQPQGMALSGNDLYVADTGNHAIRRVDLAGGAVSTVAGDGRQDEEWNGAPGPLAGRRLNSPWDLHLAHGVLFVAMAGSHQVFGIDVEGGYIAAHAGSGREDHVDGPLLAAALAQPSGLTSDGDSLFVADSEISSIRAVSLDPRGGHVRTVVGKGLFDFGDVDGDGSEVRLQHPMGVAFADGQVHVADTYNNKIKSIAVPALRARTVAGTGRPGYVDGLPDEAEFNQPGGLSHAAGSLFVADTNNHSVRKVDLATGRVSTFALRHIAPLAPPPPPASLHPEVSVRPGPIVVRIAFRLPDDHVLSRDSVSGASVLARRKLYPADETDGVSTVILEIGGDQEILVDAVAFYCSADRRGLCLYHRELLEVPLRVDPAGARSVDLRIAVGDSDPLLQ